MYKDGRLKYMPDSPNNYQPSIPPPPQPEVTTRTLQSDVQSIQEQGGALPAPEKISPPSFGDSTPVFQPSADDTVTPPGGGDKQWFWVAIVIVLAAAGAVYYFYFYDNQPAVDMETEEFVVQENFPVKQSSLPSSPVKITLEALTEALKAEASQPLPAGSLKEVALLDEGGRSVSFSELVSVILSDRNLTNVLRDNFEDQFNAYLFYDEDGAWPIYKGTMKDDAVDVITLKTRLAVLENGAVNNFYLDFPGPKNLFEDGMVNDYPTRYSSFAQPGANFNYVLVDDELILATSYDGLKKLLE